MSQVKSFPDEFLKDCESLKDAIAKFCRENNCGLRDIEVQRYQWPDGRSGWHVWKTPVAGRLEE